MSTGEGARATISQPTLVRFTETMSGPAALGETDPWRGQERGRQEGTTLSFRLTITVDDVDRFVADPAHPGTAEGWVHCEPLGGRLPVEHGEFNLFVADAPRRRRMLYRLWFHDQAGHPLTLRGTKHVSDEGGADVWSDTTTLLTQVLIGHVSEADEANGADVRATAAGVLRISVPGFARQLTTFSAEGPTRSARVAGLATFGRFFLGQLWRVYLPRLPGRRGRPDEH